MDNFMQFVINHWALWLALVIILLLIFANESQVSGASAEQLSPQEAVNKINHDNAVVFDLRSKDIYRDGHIVDAINASSDAFSQKRMEKYKNKPIILVCANGSQSNQQLKQIKSSGFEQVFSLKGGMTAWSDASFPVVKHKSAQKKQIKTAKAAND